MINFNDLIIKKGNKPLLEMELLKNTFFNSTISIYNNGNRIYKGIFNNGKHTIELDRQENKYLSYDVIIEKGTLKYSFDFAVLELNPDEPYIVCDIDFTVSATNIFLFITKNILKIRTIYRSSDVLKSLSNNYKIIYLTGRIRKYNKMTKMWLKKNAFPEGPLIARERINSNILKFKTDTLKEISKVSKNGIGIGDLSTDIISYLKNDLIAIKIVHPFLFYSKHNEKYYYKNQYYMVKSWNGIEKLFQENKWYI